MSTTNTIKSLSPNELLALEVPPIRASDPPVIQDWKAVAIRAQTDIRNGGRGDMSVSCAAVICRLAVVQLRNEGVDV